VYCMTAVFNGPTPRWATLAKVCALATLTTGLALGPAPSAWAAGSNMGSSAAKAMRIEVGQQQAWPHSRPITRAAVGDPDVLGVSPIGSSGLLLTGKKPGSTTVTLWDDKGTVPARQITVLVSPNLTAMRESVLGAAGARVDVSGPTLKLSGEMRSLDAHDNASQAAKAALPAKGGTLIDTTTSQYDVQVQIDVKILEVSRQRLKEAGLHLTHTGASGTRGLSAPGTFAGYKQQAGQSQYTATSKYDAINGLQTSQTSSQTAGALEFLSYGGSVPFSDAFNVFAAGRDAIAIFSALESNGFAYSLAEPSLTALSGQTATFLAGGELPIPLTTGMGSVSVEFKQFGIRLNLTPFVLDNQRIVLKVSPEVSEIDEALSARLGNFVVPGLRVRRTDTTVALGDGETFVISGLMNRSTKSVINKFPVLGDIPILGAFFKSTRFEKDDQELLMIATPHLVRPFAKGAKLPALPGAEAAQYSPSLIELQWLERGNDYDALTGFSK
jgi:pilus assembly protein CpaC